MTLHKQLVEVFIAGLAAGQRYIGFDLLLIALLHCLRGAVLVHRKRAGKQDSIHSAIGREPDNIPCCGGTRGQNGNAEHGKQPYRHRITEKRRNIRRRQRDDDTDPNHRCGQIFIVHPFPLMTAREGNGREQQLHTADKKRHKHTNRCINPA